MIPFFLLNEATRLFSSRLPSRPRYFPSTGQVISLESLSFHALFRNHETDAHFSAPPESSPFWVFLTSWFVSDDHNGSRRQTIFEFQPPPGTIFTGFLTRRDSDHYGQRRELPLILNPALKQNALLALRHCLSWTIRFR